MKARTSLRTIRSWCRVIEKKQKRTPHYWRDRMRRYRAEHPEVDEKHRVYYKKYYAKNRAAVLAAQKKLRAAQRRAGLCQDCGKKRPKELAAFCRRCQDEQNKRY